MTPVPEPGTVLAVAVAGLAGGPPAALEGFGGPARDLALVVNTGAKYRR